VLDNVLLKAVIKFIYTVTENFQTNIKEDEFHKYSHRIVIIPARRGENCLIFALFGLQKHCTRNVVHKTTPNPQSKEQSEQFVSYDSLGETLNDRCSVENIFISHLILASNVARKTR